MDVPEFKRSVRGYDSVEVDAVINDLNNRLSQMESDQAESARLVQRLNRELTEAKRNKPSFAELGSAFEETLRLAEDQSAKMVQDAINESQTLLNQARNEVKTLRDKADRDARQLLAQLLDEATRREFVYVHKWRQGDVLMWDNMGTIHNAVADYLPHEHRYIRRCQVAASRFFDQNGKPRAEVAAAAA